MMKHLATLSVALMLIATPPVLAQDEAEEPGLLDGIMGSFMENMLRDMAPEMEQMGDGMSGALSRLGPVLKDLSVLVDDLRHYQAPERLENGDILIRRKIGAPPAPPLGDNLRDMTTPRPDDGPAPTIPDFTPDPDQPEVEL
ncbi:hypothetical protein JJJ17_17710 [Paracoccus caeni]|uniref:AAA+ family ATPase n=1 Tax=Paracoccus caeni TaxID=657651 RepID=A0A934W1V8_9RHOB|nr:hypothetical protein [Paracoccus caeni]MBK4217773.1 hypothetical protein [Paracoccus caeni]